MKDYLSLGSSRFYEEENISQTAVRHKAWKQGMCYIKEFRSWHSNSWRTRQVSLNTFNLAQYNGTVLISHSLPLSLRSAEKAAMKAQPATPHQGSSHPSKTLPRPRLTPWSLSASRLRTANVPEEDALKGLRGKEEDHTSTSGGQVGPTLACCVHSALWP